MLRNKVTAPECGHELKSQRRFSGDRVERVGGSESPGPAWSGSGSKSWRPGFLWPSCRVDGTCVAEESVLCRLDVKSPFFPSAVKEAPEPVRETSLGHKSRAGGTQRRNLSDIPLGRNVWRR